MAAPMIDGSSASNVEVPGRRHARSRRRRRSSWRGGPCAFSDPRPDSRDYPLPPPEDRGTTLPWPGVLDAFAQAGDHSASVVVVTGFDTRGRGRWRRRRSGSTIRRRLPRRRGQVTTAGTRISRRWCAATLATVAAPNLNVVHPLTGPVHVNGAEPGDVLEAEILRVEPDRYAYTVQVPGFGFLRDQFPEPFMVRWSVADGWATSDGLPGVRIPGAPFMGTIGLAPDRRLLEVATAREQAALDRGGFVLPPDPADAVPADEAIAREALRTVPPRETAGNVDIKQLSAGTRLSVTRDGENRPEDLTLAARNALLNMIDHLVQHAGWTRQQAYAICSVAVDLKVSEVVDVPNFVVSAFLPLDIFTQGSPT